MLYAACLEEWSFHSGGGGGGGEIGPLFLNFLDPPQVRGVGWVWFDKIDCILDGFWCMGILFLRKLFAEISCTKVLFEVLLLHVITQNVCFHDKWKTTPTWARSLQVNVQPIRKKCCESQQKKHNYFAPLYHQGKQCLFDLCFFFWYIFNQVLVQ